MSDRLTLGEAKVLHGDAVEESIGGNFDVAHDYLAQAKDVYQANGSKIDIGRADRDFARVYAGLGSIGERDAAIKRAFRAHSVLRTDTDPHADEFTTVQAEHGATLHVLARIDFARFLTAKAMGQNLFLRTRLLVMAQRWEEAQSELKGNPAGTHYLSQVVAHAVPTLATYGLDSSLPLARDLRETGKSLDDVPPEHAKAFKVGGVLLMTRKLIGPHFPDFVRDRIVNEVAGPYMAPINQ